MTHVQYLDREIDNKTCIARPYAVEGWVIPQCFPNTSIIVCGLRTDFHKYCPLCGREVVFKENEE